MVVNVYQITSEVLHVSVHLDIVDSDAKMSMVVLLNHVKIMVFALVQVEVLIHVNVQLVLKEQIVNNVCRQENSAFIFYFSYVF